MKRIIYNICIVCFSLATVACGNEWGPHINKRYLCNFEGDYWNALVDSNSNGDNLANGTLATSWHDEKSGLAGEVTVPFDGYWGGLALSNHCSKDLQNDGTPTSQLYAYVDSAYSGENFLICNCFYGPVELRFESKTSFIESIMIANTTYSYAVATNGNHLTEPLPANVSIWIEAKGFIKGSDEVQATAKFYLYENGKPAFEGWSKWYMTSMCAVDRVVFSIEWNGTAEYNPYPAYFAMDNIVVVRKEPKQ
jgi:hypothetical protein